MAESGLCSRDEKIVCAGAQTTEELETPKLSPAAPPLLASTHYNSLFSSVSTGCNFFLLAGLLLHLLPSSVSAVNEAEILQNLNEQLMKRQQYKVGYIKMRLIMN